MENPVFLPISNNTILDITEMDQFIPKELQMAVGIAVCQPYYCVRRQFVSCIVFVLFILLVPMS